MPCVLSRWALTFSSFAMMRSLLAATVVLSCVAFPLAAQKQAAPTRTDLGDGIYLFQTAPYGDVGLDGNSVVIVSDSGVLVFDANGTPDAARAVLSEIRRLTSQPVKFLVQSHWHWDHWYGTEVYRAAFPSLQIVAHEKTRALMDGPAIVFNQPFLDEQLPGHVRELEGALGKARATSEKKEQAAKLAIHLANDQHFLEQKRNTHHTLATVTYSDSITLYLGKRVIKVLHHDRAITPGDSYLYMPNERVVVAGDLLINPITFALFCYPSGWISTLDAIDALDARMIIPGHGKALNDEKLLHATRALLVRERDLAKELKAQGRNAADAGRAILADSAVLALRNEITGGDTSLNDSFAPYLVHWFVRRVYQELDGTLDDSIPKTP